MNKNSCPSFQQKLTCSASYTRGVHAWAKGVGTGYLSAPGTGQGTGHSRRIQSRREAVVSGTVDLGSHRFMNLKEPAVVSFILLLFYYSLFIIYLFSIIILLLLRLSPFDIYHFIYSTYFGLNMLFLSLSVSSGRN